MATSPSETAGADGRGTLHMGYSLSCEEHRPKELVDWAKRAESIGFEYASISDHFHPWLEAQGNSPFVWSVLGGIATATQRLRVGTGVTCPTRRYHPGIVAQAAATVASMMPGRFYLGVGTGENLNEHIIGESWPRYAVRDGSTSRLLAPASTSARCLSHARSGPAAVEHSGGTTARRQLRAQGTSKPVAPGPAARRRRTWTPGVIHPGFGPEIFLWA